MFAADSHYHFNVMDDLAKILEEYGVPREFVEVAVPSDRRRSDAENLRSDWDKVGQGLRHGMKIVDEQQRKAR